MFARFSPAARRVLRAAEQECRNLNHYYVGVEHLLLALLDEHDAAIEATFTDRGLSVAELRGARTPRAGNRGRSPVGGDLTDVPRLRTVVELAEERAKDGGLIEPLDLLLAIDAEGGGHAAALLRAEDAFSRVPPSSSG